MIKKLLPLPVLLLFAIRVTAADSDTNATWLAEQYTKYEYRIPMRDGIRLFRRTIPSYGPSFSPARHTR